MNHFVGSFSIGNIEKSVSYSESITKLGAEEQTLLSGKVEKSPACLNGGVRA